MVPAEIDITVRQGKTFRKRFWYGTKPDPEGPDPNPTTDPPTNFAPHDLSGCTARMQVRQNVEDAIPLLDLDDTTITVGDAEGWVLVVATATQTAAFDFEPNPAFVGVSQGQGVYDLEVEFPDGEVIGLAEGAATLIPEVTR